MFNLIYHDPKNEKTIVKNYRTREAAEDGGWKTLYEENDRCLIFDSQEEVLEELNIWWDVVTAVVEDPEPVYQIITYNYRNIPLSCVETKNAELAWRILRDADCGLHISDAHFVVEVIVRSGGVDVRSIEKSREGFAWYNLP